jgi:hypothetical protein
VTGRNKWLCSPVFLLITVQSVAGLGITAAYLQLKGGSSFNAYSLTSVDERPDQPLPEAILDLFRLCTHAQWKPGSLTYNIIELAFGVFSPSNFCWCSEIFHVLHHRSLRLLGALHHGQERAAA